MTKFSNNTGFAFLHASLNALDAAILNDNSLESTSWKDQNVNVAFISTIGNQAKNHLL